MTNHQKILNFMAKYPTYYFYYHDLMRPEVGVGYLANRRLQELKHDYPQIFETKKEGSQTKTRLKLATIKEWYYDLPDKLKSVLRMNGLEPKLTHQEILERNGFVLSND